MKTVVLSDMARVLASEIPARYAPVNVLNAFDGECCAFQIAYQGEEAEWFQSFRVQVESALPFDVYRVRDVAVQWPCAPSDDMDYLRKEPGLLPDFLEPLAAGCPCDPQSRWQSLFFLCEKAVPGVHTVTVTLTDASDGHVMARDTLTVRVSRQALPPQTLTYTRWFHCDCLASYYNVPPLSEAHWTLMERFLSKAAQRGMTMVLTPIHTPPLDTAVGTERPTVQLVDVTVGDDGGYAFGFEKLDRWVAMCRRCGIEKFEMAHLFSQWGLKTAPKIVAALPGGETRRIFGWDTPSDGDYLHFLDSYLPALGAHLKALGIADQVFFHVSDEPGEQDIALYKRLKAHVQALLPGFHFIDAMSDIAFYNEGAAEHPIPANDHLEPFLAAGVPDLWTYYCCGQQYLVPNSFIAMPGERVRALGVLLYMHNLKGFLQWGYNFYYGRISYYPLDPYRTADGDGTWPAGDPFIVYPSRTGEALDSLRHIATQKALEDYRALCLAESRLGREKTRALVMEGVAAPMTFTCYPRNEQYFLNLRARLADALDA